MSVSAAELEKFKNNLKNFFNGLFKDCNFAKSSKIKGTIALSKIYQTFKSPGQMQLKLFELKTQIFQFVSEISQCK